MAKRLDAALAAAAGISVDVTPEAKALVPGTPANFDITITNHGSMEAKLYTVDLGGMGMGEGHASSTRVLPAGQMVKLVRTFTAPAGATLTVPHHEHLYDGKVFGEKFAATVTVVISGGAFQAPATVAVDVAPAVEIASVEPLPLMLTPGTLAKPPRFTVLVINNRDKKTVVGLDADSSQYRDLGPFSGVFELGPHENHLTESMLAYGTTEAYKDGQQKAGLIPKDSAACCTDSTKISLTSATRTVTTASVTSARPKGQARLAVLSAGKEFAVGLEREQQAQSISDNEQHGQADAELAGQPRADPQIDFRNRGRSQKRNGGKQ